jgi:predicted dehydrogenase
MNKVRWGVLSTAKIGVEKVIPAMQLGEYSQAVAIASRNKQKAEEVAKQLGLAKAYDNYQSLLNDPDIDAIYNPLPNHLHLPWSIRALRAGKHVLCEKPIGLNAKEAEELLAVSKKYPHLKIMEAFMYRFHPQQQKVREIIDGGKIGQLNTMQCFFSYNNRDPKDIRNIAEYGGGGLLDIGCYCISISRLIFGREPERVFGQIEFDPVFNVDRLCSGILDFGIGNSEFTCATQTYFYQWANILGSEGRIEMEIPYTPPNDRPCKIFLYDHEGREKIVFEIQDQYTLQGDKFSQAILNNSEVPTPLEDAVNNMKVIDGIFLSAKTGKWV